MEVESKSTPKDNVVYAQNMMPDALYVLEHGSVLGIVEKNDRLYPIFKMTSPAVFGEEVLSECDKRVSSIITLDDCKLKVIPKALVKDSLDQAPDWVKELMGEMVDKFEKTIDIISINKISSVNVTEDIGFDEELETSYKNILSGS
jgi:CRP-like cAMP-binding protein